MNSFAGSVTAAWLGGGAALAAAAHPPRVAEAGVLALAGEAGLAGYEIVETGLPAVELGAGCER